MGKGLCTSYDNEATLKIFIFSKNIPTRSWMDGTSISLFPSNRKDYKH